MGLLTLAGAVVRAWELPRLGLSHFDEGIYAIAGLWSVSPGGLTSFDPTLVPYAPPGFPILVGLPIWGWASVTWRRLVSIRCGTLTIPAAAWLARRTFGSGAGAAAGALVAFSGFHVTFSRMALTDVSFLLCWFIGTHLRPAVSWNGPTCTAIALGLSVGLTQGFKYNGWLLGAFVVLAAGAWGSSWTRRNAIDGRLRADLGFRAPRGVSFQEPSTGPGLPTSNRTADMPGLLKHHQSYMGSCPVRGCPICGPTRTSGSAFGRTRLEL